MVCLRFIWVIVLLGLPVAADHFRGGTISWKPIYNNVSAGDPVAIMITQTYSWTWSLVGCNNSMIATQSPLVSTGAKVGSGLSLLCNDSCSTAGGYVGNELPIMGPCTDFSTALDLTVAQRVGIVNLTANASFTATFGASGGWPILALGSAAGWSLSNRIDLRPRPDNGLINTSPVATCISYIGIPVGVPQTIRIPVLDADNDVIRCRYANGTSECVNACPPGSLPVGTTLSSQSCSLTITGVNVSDYYLVALQVEDFISNASTMALSSVPLQFLVYVYALPACTLKPLLIADRDSATCQVASVGTSFTITFTAINRCGSGRTMTDIATLSFPVILKSALVQNISNASLWSMQITWVPTLNQVGSQVFCAVASDNASVQSDQYCLTIFVGVGSAPLCPGATVAPTTMQTSMAWTSMPMTTYQSTMAPTTTSTIVTSQTSTTTGTTSTSRTSAATSEKKVDWPLILILTLLPLALAFCCSLCCCYYLCCSKDRKRRRRNRPDELKEDFRSCRNERDSPFAATTRENNAAKHNRVNENKRDATSDHPRLFSGIPLSRCSQRENLIEQHLQNQSANSSHTSKSSVNQRHVPRCDASLSSRRKIVPVKDRTVQRQSVSPRTARSPEVRERRPSSVSVTRIKRARSSSHRSHSSQRIATGSRRTIVRPVSVTNSK